MNSSMIKTPASSTEAEKDNKQFLRVSQPLNLEPTKVRAAYLCARYSVSRTTLWRWTKDPAFPQPIKRGNVVMFDLAAVEAWLNGEGV